MNLKNEIQNFEKFGGLEKFINNLLFNNIQLPELLSDDSYPLGERITTRYYFPDDDPATADAEWGMRQFENAITSFSWENKHKKAREEIVKVYESSAAKNIIQDLIENQKTSYIDYDLSPLDLNDEDIKFAFVETFIVPIHIKSFLSNHFADIFQEYNFENKTIPKAQYDNLLKKYLKYKTREEILHNMHVGIHNQVTEPQSFPDEYQCKAYKQHQLLKIKARIKD
jgi:hypothetical protein